MSLSTFIPAQISLDCATCGITGSMEIFGRIPHAIQLGYTFRGKTINESMNFYDEIYRRPFTEQYLNNPEPILCCGLSGPKWDEDNQTFVGGKTQDLAWYIEIAQLPNREFTIVVNCICGNIIREVIRGANDIPPMGMKFADHVKEIADLLKFISTTVNNKLSINVMHKIYCRTRALAKLWSAFIVRRDDGEIMGPSAASADNAADEQSERILNNIAPSLVKRFGEICESLSQYHREYKDRTDDNSRKISIGMKYLLVRNNIVAINASLQANNLINPELIIWSNFLSAPSCSRRSARAGSAEHIGVIRNDPASGADPNVRQTIGLGVNSWFSGGIYDETHSVRLYTGDSYISMPDDPPKSPAEIIYEMIEKHEKISSLAETVNGLMEKIASLETTINILVKENTQIKGFIFAALIKEGIKKNSVTASAAETPMTNPDTAVTEPITESTADTTTDMTMTAVSAVDADRDSFDTL